MRSGPVDQCLAESFALATNESEERDRRMTQEIERILNDHNSIYAQIMTKLENRLDVKGDFMMRKLDELLSSSNQKIRSGPRMNLRQTTSGFRAPDIQRLPGDREQVLSLLKGTPGADPSGAGWMDPIPPEAEALSGARLPTVPHVRLVPDLTTFHMVLPCTDQCLSH